MSCSRGSLQTIYMFCSFSKKSLAILFRTESKSGLARSFTKYVNVDWWAKVFRYLPDEIFWELAWRSKSQTKKSAKLKLELSMT